MSNPVTLYNRVVGDLEADGLNPTRVWCGVFKDIDTKIVYKFGPDDVPEMLSFMDSCKTVIMHNGLGFDFPILERLYNYKYKGNKVDTLIMSRLQRPHRKSPYGCKAGPHSVEAWGVRFGIKKPEHEDWSRFTPEMLYRCEQDVEIQHRILTALLEEGKGQGWKQAHKISFRVFEILQKQEEYGWLVDQEYMQKQINVLTRWMDRIDRAVTPFLPMRCIRPTKTGGRYAYYKKPFTKTGKYQAYVERWFDDTDYDSSARVVAGPFSRVAFSRTDLGSNDQVKEFLLAEGWVPENWNLDDQGNRRSPKLNHNESFEGVNGAVGRLIARRVQCRHRRSQIEGWQKVVRPDGRIGQGISGIASTGRLTHKRIVNVPGDEAFFGKQMRKVFIAKPGYRVVGVDSAGCQNRMLAARVNDPEFTKTLIEGRKEDKTSIHFVNQRAVTKIAGFTPSYKVCKNLNYAFLFGASDKKLASTAGVNPGKGELIRKALLSVSPGLERLVNELQQEWRSTASRRKGRFGVEYYNGYIKGLDGRPVFIESEHCLLVYMLQADEALLMQYALVFLYDWLSDLGWEHGREYGFVANVHDEIQAEVREDLVTQYAELAEQSIVYAGEYLKIACPHKGESDIGFNWHDTH